MAMLEVVAASAVAAAAAWWAGQVQGQLGETAYMDEIFHIRQAQAYCDGRFGHWDPKITTPPGLYLLSVLVASVTGSCSARALRSVNVIGVVVVFAASLELLNNGFGAGRPVATTNRGHAVLVAIAISMFPALFFFSGLYYTDVVSTASVLTGLLVVRRYNAALAAGSVPAQLLWQVVVVVVGLFSFLCRQTNVFWAVLFPAGLTVVSILDREPPSSDSDQKSSVVHQDDGHAWTDVVSRAWFDATIHNPPTDDADLLTLPKTAISVLVAATARPVDVAVGLLPYAVLAAGFVGFVVVNGSVVLGDKSNHVASLHLAQPLYLAAYILVFSFPAFLPLGFSILAVPVAAALKTSKKTFVVVISALAVVAAVVRYNTIIHPFLLADNRHYTFYFFRLLRLYPSLRYALVPGYVAAGWAIWHSFGQTSTRATAGERRSPESSPVGIAIPAIFIATAVLSIVSAPLVEPRYFIVPWAVWRIATNSRLTAETDSRPKLRLLIAALEIGWFVAVNALSAYLFLHRPFLWLHAPEEGLQRFMW